ncbi:hypothetical protein [Clostridium chromiireducens]|nr:hypothetical protein [Clostridium chromiireducens]
MIISYGFYFFTNKEDREDDYIMENTDTSLAHDKLHIEPETSGDL